MGSSAPATLTPKGFKFTKNLVLLNQAASLGFEFASQLAPDVAAALATDTQPLPARDIELSEVKLNASTPKPIEFARGQDKISFTASGSAFAGLGVYRTGNALLKKLGEGAEDFSLDALEFGVDDQSLLSVLRWGYSASGKVSGAMALSAAGKATLAVSGSAEGLFGVIRRLPAGTPARAVVQFTADSWMLPRQISSIDQVEPGTWIVAEVMGGISVKLGAQLGYDFSWVREAKLGGLSGDIGLRLQMGINAAVGFAASGRCAVVVSRDSDQKLLRLRFFKLKTRQLDVTLDASLGIQAIDTLLPGRIDDFIAAVFDAHGQQILSDLKILDKWTNPNTSLAKLLAEAGLDGAEKLIAHMAGVAPDKLQEEFDRVHTTAVSFINKWHDLPNRVSSTILKLVEEKVDLTTVRSVATQLSAITPQSLQNLLETQLNRLDFFHTPEGRFLEAIADQGVLSLPAQPLADIRKIASQALAVLDGSLMEDQLKKFQGFIESELHLDRVFRVVTETDFASLDALLRKKLANFLGQDKLILPELEKVRKVLNLLLSKREEYYRKALEALHRKYNFELAAAYQSVTTDQALFDATFDFTQDPATVSTFLQMAVQGKLDDLLTNHHPQVKIGVARISHGTKRQTTIDVTMPFLRLTETHLNESLASVEAASQDGGLLFALHSSDTVASNQRKSVLSLATNLKGTAGLRIHDDSVETNYTLLYAKQNMKVEHVKAQVGPAVSKYFSSRIASLDEFLNLIDHRAEESIPNGPQLLGNGLISLQVSLSPAAAKLAGQAWLSLPADKNAGVYQDLSRGIQASVKNNVYTSYFVDPDKYSDRLLALTILAYCAVVPAAPPPIGPGGIPLWDSASPAERRKMLKHPQTLERMKALLKRAQDTLQGDSQVQLFDPRDTKTILDNVDVNGAGVGGFIFEKLLLAESGIVRKAFEGGLAIGTAKDARPSEAVIALAEFGSSLTEAFHERITTLLGPGLRPLGTRVFLDAAHAITRTEENDKETNAMLNLEFLKPGIAFDSSALLSAGHVKADQLAFADRVVQVALA